MRRDVDLLIEDLRNRGDFLNSKIVYYSPGIALDGELMYEAASRLQQIEVLEKELEEANLRINELEKEAIGVRYLLKRKGILIE